MPAISSDELFNLVKELEVVDTEVLNKIYQQCKDSGRSLVLELVEKDLITDENLIKVISDFLKLPYVLLSKVHIEKGILKVLPEEFARSQKIIAFEYQNNELHLASSEKVPQEIIENVSKKVNSSVKLFYTSAREIENALSLYRDAIDTKLQQLLGNAELPIADIVDTIIQYAYDQRASDIHIEPEETISLIRFRIDGVLEDIAKLPKKIHDQIITRIKVASNLRTDEHMSAQDGKIRMSLPQEELDIRVSIVPIVSGEKTVLRLLTSHFKQFGLTDLGLSDVDYEKVKRAYQKSSGMILSTGPTGSGKTTTIYSVLKILNTREKNIATIEDPVEYEISGINQIQVNTRTNLTFAQGLRSILRQDPDIIYVGEIRDEETAGIAVNSAMTGHLVLSTLHTNDSATTLPRLLDLGVEPFLVSSTVNLIIAQRLVRKICEHCRESFVQDTPTLLTYFTKEQISKYFANLKEIRFYKGAGCKVCHNTGYLDRVGVFEVLEVNDEIKKMIEQQADSKQIIGQAIKNGMTTMLEDGLMKISKGITTLEEILRVANT